eukprot:4548683-Amphidinium_carterae.1
MRALTAGIGGHERGVYASSKILNICMLDSCLDAWLSLARTCLGKSLDSRSHSGASIQRIVPLHQTA